MDPLRWNHCFLFQYREQTLESTKIFQLLSVYRTLRSQKTLKYCGARFFLYVNHVILTIVTLTDV